MATVRRGSAAGPGTRLGFQTFAGLPFVLDVAGAEVAVMGVPFDGGSSRRPGARFAPEAIRDASAMLEPYHPEHGIDVFAQLRAVDWGDVELVPGHNARAFDEIEGEILIFLGRGVTPLALGGDGTIVGAELAALASAFGPPALVMLDAHADSLHESDDELNSRGGAVRRAVEDGQVRPQQSLIAGLRGSLTGPGELSWPASMGIELISRAQLRELGPDGFAARVRERVGDCPVHLSVDLDVVDPAYAPAVGTPELDGLTSGELLALLRALAGVSFASFDVVELTPPYDGPGQTTALLAANVAYEFLALAAMAPRSEALS